MLRILLLWVCLVAVSHGSALQSRERVPLDDWDRIVNGIPAAPGEFPSQLSLRSFGNHICGASILEMDWALTAAHCVSGATVAEISFLAGTYNIQSGDGTVHPAAKIIIHSGYDSSDSWVNDIAVVRVSVPFRLDDYHRSQISLPWQGQKTAEKAVGTVIGWGRSSEGGDLPRLLEKVNIMIGDQEP